MYRSPPQSLSGLHDVRFIERVPERLLRLAGAAREPSGEEGSRADVEDQAGTCKEQGRLWQPQGARGAGGQRHPCRPAQSGASDGPGAA